MIRPQSVVRCYSFVRQAGAVTQARWESVAAPAPVESQDDFDRRLAVVEQWHRRLPALTALCATIAGVGMAFHWNWT